MIYPDGVMAKHHQEIHHPASFVPYFAQTPYRSVLVQQQTPYTYYNIALLCRYLVAVVSMQHIGQTNHDLSCVDTAHAVLYLLIPQSDKW